MSAPVTERTRGAARTTTTTTTRTPTRNRTATIPAQRGAPVAVPTGWDKGREKAPAREPAGGGRSTSRAYARRDERLRRLLAGRPVRTAAPAGRPQFVLLIMVLLAVGLVATLWLSTAAAADSYRLQDAREQARSLTEQSERLRREVAVMQSPPELARRAAQLGMVPVQDPARLVVAPDGGVTVVGEPQAAAPAPQPLPDTAAAEAAAAAAESDDPAVEAPPADPTAPDTTDREPAPDMATSPDDANTAADAALAAGEQPQSPAPPAGQTLPEGGAPAGDGAGGATGTDAPVEQGNG
jgi:hypothetical protein